MPVLVQHYLGIQICFCQFLFGYAQGSGDFFQGFVAQGIPHLQIGIGKVIALIQLAAQLVVAVGAPQAFAVFPVANVGDIILHPFAHGIQMFGGFGPVFVFHGVGMHVTAYVAAACGIAVIALGIEVLSVGGNGVVIHTAVLAVRGVTALARRRTALRIRHGL